MIQAGHDSTAIFLTQYERAIPGKSSQYILLCNLRTHFDWFNERYESAIRWGEEGERLKTLTSVDTAFSTKHNLALSLRDGHRIREAIEMFREDEPLDVVIRKGDRIEGKDAPFYGNIGRCLFLVDRLDDALICYIKSAQLLEEGRSHQDLINKGYIRLWIGELLARQGRFDVGAASFRAAVCIWADSSPPRATIAGNKLRSLTQIHPDLRSYLDAPDWRVEDEYRNWLYRQ